MDVGIGLLKGIPGTLIAPPGMLESTTIMHPFTGIQISEKGIETLVDYVAKVREVIGYEIPLGSRSLWTYRLGVLHSSWVGP